MVVEQRHDRMIARAWRERDHALLPPSIQQVALQALEAVRTEGGLLPFDAIINEALTLLSGD
jgi:hypothetical protein